MKTLLAALFALLLALPATADEVEVLMVKAMQKDATWQFDITVHHHDEGGEHMMDSVAIFTPDETLIGIAKIPMPSIGADHVTTKVTGVTVPEGVEYILIRGHCSHAGWTHEGIIISLM